jgi:hypothetical protein
MIDRKEPAMKASPKSTLLFTMFAVLLMFTGCEQDATEQNATAKREIVFGSASSDLADPQAAGKAAATAAKAKLGDAPLKAVIISECYEDREYKAKVLAGVCSVFGKEKVYGLATYGSFTQAGVAGGESVTVLAIAGKDIEVNAVCQKKMGASKLTMANHEAQIQKKLTAAGQALAKQLPKDKAARLLVVLADAHSPKNGFLVSGLQAELGKGFPITGGCANKNAGQTFVYYKGELLTDAAVGLQLSGDFKIAMAGRQAKENDKVIATAKQAAEEVVGKLKKQGAEPAGYLAFDCAGRKGKLKNVADELTAMKGVLGASPQLFGTYNAGEIGPADVSEAKPGVLSSGVGWHVMLTGIGW